MKKVFSGSILGEKNPKYESGGRKSIYCDATDFQPTAQLVKLGLNPLSLLLIHHNYKDQVGKPSRRCFPAAFWAKISEMWIWRTKIDILWCDRFPTYCSRSQIGFKTSPIASNRSQINTWSRKTITNVFSRSILREKNPRYGSARRKSTYCDATDFQPTLKKSNRV